MDRIDFKQQGGFPLIQDTLDYLQDAYGNALSGLAKVLGDKVILWGCEKTPLGVVQEGMVSLGGELLYTAGGADGTGTATVFVEEAVFKEVTFEDGTSKGVYKKRQLVFGSGTPQWNWSEFRRLETVVGLQEPIGTVKMWWGNADKVPAGWAICDGTNGTPDMRSRFPVGANPLADGTGDLHYALGKTGGENRHTLTAAETAKHVHWLKNYYFAEARTGVLDNVFFGSDNIGDYRTSGSHSSDNDNNYLYWIRSATEENLNGGGAHENRPPYLALYFIMKIQNI